jgi:hypothetical protein
LHCQAFARLPLLLLLLLLLPVFLLLEALLWQSLLSGRLADWAAAPCGI